MKARLGAAGACAGAAGAGWCRGGLGEAGDHANALQLLPGMFADCHFHLTCSFFLWELEMKLQPLRLPPLNATAGANVGLNGDTLSTKATSGVGPPRLRTVKLWIILIGGEKMHIF